MDGLQVNFCKMPHCANFGIAPKQGVKEHRKRVAYGDNYTWHGSADLMPGIRCNLCGQIPRLKSNLAIVEECRRLWEPYEPSVAPGCPNQGCSNRSVPVGSVERAYRFYGRTKAGSQRVKCKECGRHFSVANRTTLRQRLALRNTAIFEQIFGQTPMRRICKVLHINPAVLYNRIPFFHRQCMLFAAEHERKLLEGMEIQRLYIGVDRQDYNVNWSSSKDRRNTVLRAIGSADNTTKYVFGMHLAFDPDVDRAAVEADAIAIGDGKLPTAYRKHARVWIESDWDSEFRRRRKKYRTKDTPRARAARARRYGSRPVLMDVDRSYAEAKGRVDCEVPEVHPRTTRVPTMGVQTHEEYTTYAHFFFMKKLLAKVPKVRFFFDRDAMIRAACLSAFADRIKSREVDAFFVNIDKDMNRGQKLAAKARADERLQAMKAKFPEMSARDVELEFIKEEMRNPTLVGPFGDKWIRHPLPTMGEPDKEMCMLTDLGDYSEDHKARLFRRVSLHSLDCFFQQVRRSMSLLERAIPSANGQRKMWYDKNPYNPRVISHLLEIYRVVHNFVEIGEDRRTPAMRLGLVDRPIKVHEILNFMRNSGETLRVA